MLSSIVASTLAASGDGNAVTPDAPKPCTGFSGMGFDKPENLYYLYYNSCDAANLHDVVEGGAVALGFVSAVTGVLTEGLAFLPTGVEGMFPWLLQKDMDRAINRSTLDAMIIRVSLDYKRSAAGHYYAPMRIYPQ